MLAKSGKWLVKNSEKFVVGRFVMVKKPGRPSWDLYFMQLAEFVAARSTCDRKSVGAVIVKDKRILATGYNGSVSGLPHCDEEGHLIRDNHCVRTIHAEANAILSAARHGVSIEGATIYINTFPCFNCFKLIANAGIKRICYCDPYNPDLLVFEFAEKAGIELVEVVIKERINERK
ncbi:MAG: ComE operon protein 2 [Myxococcota bacterium]